MIKPTKAQAKAYLQEALDEIPGLRQLDFDSLEFTKWHRSTRIAMNYIFGADSQNTKEFKNIEYLLYYPDEDVGVIEIRDAEIYARGLHMASAMLESMVEEIDRWWPDDVQAAPGVVVPSLIGTVNSNRVFVVHGRDEAAKQTVARYLEGLGLEPVILQEQPSQGRTIIEKFEDYAQTVGFAVILGIPDDIGGLAGEADNLQPRMRQNVVLELGYFAGAIGRKRVCALLKGGVERPSDYDGVIYIPLDDFGGWQMELAKEMRAAGLPVDLNRLLQA